MHHASQQQAYSEGPRMHHQGPTALPANYSNHSAAMYAPAPLYPTYSMDQQHQRMWPLVRRIFPTEENLLKTLFVIHLVLLSYFTLKRDVQVNNWYIELYNSFFIYFLCALLFIAIFWSLMSPRDYNPMDLAQLLELVFIGIDGYVLYKLYSRFAFEAHVEKFIFWHLVFIFRILAFVLLRKMWADRCAAALEIMGIQTTPSKVSPRSMIAPAREYGSPANSQYAMGANRDEYLYQASLNA